MIPYNDPRVIKNSDLRSLLCQFIVINNHNKNFQQKAYKVLTEINCSPNTECYKSNLNKVKQNMEIEARILAKNKLNIIQKTEVRDKGVLIIRSAGNDGVEVELSLDARNVICTCGIDGSCYISSKSKSKIIIVASGCKTANGCYDKLYLISNYGKNYVDILAPDGDIP